jgi:uncharacterized protein (TIGR02266 family)
MIEKRERRSHFRGKPRPGRRVELAYRVIDTAGEESDESRAFTRNIGIGGAFVVTEDPAPPGAELRLVVQIPTSGKSIEVRGEVRWIADGDLDAVHGMGVKFHGLDVDQLLELNEYFTSLTSTVDHDEA